MRRHLNSVQLVGDFPTEWERKASAAYDRVNGRETAVDPLAPSKQTRWCVVRNLYGAVLEIRLLPAGTDLKRAFVAVMLDWIDAGWQLGDFSSGSAMFYCSRGFEQRMVEFTPIDPSETRG